MPDITWNRQQDHAALEQTGASSAQWLVDLEQLHDQTPSLALLWGGIWDWIIPQSCCDDGPVSLAPLRKLGQTLSTQIQAEFDAVNLPYHNTHHTRTVLLLMGHALDT